MGRMEESVVVSIAMAIGHSHHRARVIGQLDHIGHESGRLAQRFPSILGPMRGLLQGQHPLVQEKLHVVPQEYGRIG